MSIVAVPVHVARHSPQTSFWTSHEPHHEQPLAPEVVTFVEPVANVRRLVQSSPITRVVHTHDAFGFVAQSK